MAPSDELRPEICDTASSAFTSLSKAELGLLPWALSSFSGSAESALGAAAGDGREGRTTRLGSGGGGGACAATSEELKSETIDAASSSAYSSLFKTELALFPETPLSFNGSTEFASGAGAGDGREGRATRLGGGGGGGGA